MKLGAFLGVCLTIPFFVGPNAFAYDDSIGALQYYKDGVYDSTSQINKHLRNGLQEQVMDQYIGKYLVMIDLEKFSVVDILFFETIAEKNHIMDVYTVKNVQTSKSYMVFGGYERKADADMISDKMNESGIETLVKLNNEVFVKNPMVVKKFLGDIRELIKDMPVKVVKIEKTIAKDGYAKQSPSTNDLPPPPAIDEYALQAELFDIEKRWKESGEVAENNSYVAMKNSKINKKSFYGMGEKIGCFTVTWISTNQQTCTYGLEIMSPGGKKYSVYRQKTNCGLRKIAAYQKPKIKTKKVVARYQKASKPNDIRSEFCEEEKQNGPKNVQQQAPKGVGVYCDFNKIKFGTVGGNNVAISETKFAGKQMAMTAEKKGAGYTLSSDIGSIFVREKFFNAGCSR